MSLSSLSWKPTEVIAGYTVRERIGVGGCGEVWRADAPGGLTKAIKFVYGCLDDERALRELKALNCIKEVRHPFLLSLERFEVIDGQLVIITELADLSLKDRYRQCIESGLPGIPREELLLYLRDTADALDYMSENYSLQHLDIKPENLLIVGGRAKVADFGLVKDIQDASVSLMGGLTPVYAPPELFDGRPSLQSDQYSLAIVYQEMLTGELPFPGSTPSQLIKQHLNSSPRLDALPASDRVVIARALSKGSDRRFPSCREMIQCLLDAQPLEPKKETRVPPVSGRPDAETAPTPTLAASPIGKPELDLARDTGAGSSAAVQTLDLTSVRSSVQESVAESRAGWTSPQPDTAGTIETHPPIEVSPEEIGLRPTLILGIGGTAAKTLQRLNRRLFDRFGDLANVPAMQILLLDTDLASVAHATEGPPGAALASQNTLVMPLRKRQDYRADSERLLQWLSRRWLYNIPRSLQTEGRRPLGRLALIDHAEKLFRRLRTALVTITAPEAAEASSKATGLPVRDRVPRVFILASISGGTGSGMVLDIGYAVRAIMSDLGIADSGVCGVLAHSTPRNPNAKDLAVANAYVCLNELHHYGRVGEYPGDAAFQLPPATGKHGPFEDTYLVHLGNDLGEADHDAATDVLAEYLYLDTATAAGAFFDKCRQSARSDGDSRPLVDNLRTFGLFQTGCSQSNIPATLATLICRQLVERWCGEKDTPKDEDPLQSSRPHTEWSPASSESAADITETKPELPEGAEDLQLDLEHFVTQVSEATRGEMRNDTKTDLRSYLDRNVAGREAKRSGSKQDPPLVHFFNLINTLFGTRSENDDLRATPEGVLQRALDDHLKTFATEHGTAICNWILELAGAPDASVMQTRQAALWAIGHVQSLEAKASVMLQRLQVPLVQSEHILLGATPAIRADPKRWLGIGRRRKQSSGLDPQWTKYFSLRLDQMTLHRTCELLRAVSAEVSVIAKRLTSLGQELELLVDEFAEISSDNKCVDTGTPSNSLHDLYSSVTEALRSRVPEMAAEVDEQLNKDFFAKHGGLRSVLEMDIDLRGPFSDVLRGAARTAVLHALNQMNIAELLLASPKEPGEPNGLLRVLADAAAPPVLKCGGSQRLLVVCPAGSAEPLVREAFVEQLNETPSVVYDSDGDLVLCYEAERISVANAAANLIDNRSDFAEVASRLHARIDVAWSELSQLEPL